MFVEICILWWDIWYGWLICFISFLVRVVVLVGLWVLISRMNLLLLRWVMVFWVWMLVWICLVILISNRLLR